MGWAPEGSERTWDEDHRVLLLAEQRVVDGAGHVPHGAVRDHGQGDPEEAVSILGISLLQGGHDLTIWVPPHCVGLRVPPFRRAFQPDAPILMVLHLNEGLGAQAWGQRDTSKTSNSEACSW